MQNNYFASASSISSEKLINENKRKAKNWYQDENFNSRCVSRGCFRIFERNYLINDLLFVFNATF